jgi:hypothetical protein
MPPSNLEPALHYNLLAASNDGNMIEHLSNSHQSKVSPKIPAFQTNSLVSVSGPTFAEAIIRPTGVG